MRMDDMIDPSTESCFIDTTPRMKKRGKNEKKKEGKLRPEIEQYSQQLTGLLGKERQRLAQQILIATEKGDKKAVYLLLHQRVLSPSQCIGMQGFSPLHHASSRGHLEIAQLLLSFGWPIDHANNIGETSLHLACHGGHLNIVECLIDKGANVNAVNEELDTPLFYAARKGFFRIVRLLLRRDALASLKNHYGDIAEDEAKNEETRNEFSTGMKQQSINRKEDLARMHRNQKDGDIILRSIHLEHIFAFLDTRSLGHAMQVSYRWQQAADTPRLWQSLGVSRWELSLNMTVGLGVVAPMTGYRPTPRKVRRPSTSNATDLYNTTGHLGYHNCIKSPTTPARNAPSQLPPRPQTARVLPN